MSLLTVNWVAVGSFSKTFLGRGKSLHNSLQDEKEIGTHNYESLGYHPKKGATYSIVASENALGLKWVSREHPDVSLLFHLRNNCIICNQKFIMKSNLFSHYDCGNCYNFTCKLCDVEKAFVHTQHLDEHLRIVHKYTEANVDEYHKATQKTARSNIADFIGPVGELEKHVGTNKAIWPEGRCSCCLAKLGKGHDEESCKKSNYQISNRIAINLRFSISANSLVCTLCNKVFKNKDSLRKHLSYCGKAVQRVKCFFCPNEYAKARGQLEHMKKVHKIEFEAKLKEDAAALAVGTKSSSGE